MGGQSLPAEDRGNGATQYLWLQRNQAPSTKKLGSDDGPPFLDLLSVG
jgi:hypothetical protein